jgi:Tfp pilus assembly protein PilN
VLGGLALLLVMVLLAISYSNKLHTIEDQTAAITAETQQHAAVAAAAQTTPDKIADDLKARTVMVGGLAKTRFPWGSALYALTKSLPPDSTLNTITANSGSPAGAASGAPSAGSATLNLEGCVSGWVGYSRLMTWLKTMPGVESVKSTSSATANAGTGDDANRSKNCGPRPLNFTLTVTYGLRTIDLTGLPKPAAGASGATGAAPGAAATGTPAASTAPAPADAAAGGGN